jgi:methylmalonyl-CoA mutase N-terminal domain/subunit
MGGMLQAIECGYIQGEIQSAAYEYQRAIEEGRQIVVGVNKFESSDPGTLQPFKIDAALEKAQVERVRTVRATRSGSEVERALASLEQTARSTGNLMPHILECCRAFATVGEISHCLRRVFGEYRERF